MRKFEKIETTKKRQAINWNYFCDVEQSGYKEYIS